MDSLRRLTSFSLTGRRSLTGAPPPPIGLLSPRSEAAAEAAQCGAPGLDITFITERLVVMGVPVYGPTNKKENQNNIDDLVEYLDANHSNQYLIFNLNPLDEQAPEFEFLGDSRLSAGRVSDLMEQEDLLQGITDKVHEQMLEFSWDRDGMKAHTPPFDLIFRICYAIFAWLSLDPNHIALLHCQTGKTRSGIVVACYLLYARLADDPIDAFVEFYRKRWDMKTLTPDALRQKTPASIQRFLTGFHELTENQVVPNEKPLLLKAIIFRALPVELQPCVQIWDDYHQIFCTTDFSCATPSTHEKDAPVIEWNGEDGFLAILWEKGLNLDGGFSILCSFGDEYDDAENMDATSKVLFRYADSTWFLAPGLITLTKNKLDMMKQYEHGFDEEQFSIDLVLHESSKERRTYVPVDCTGNNAVKQGLVEITRHHLVLPDPAMHSNFIKMGFNETATTFALQRSQNAPNVALDLLHSDGLSACFAQETVKKQPIESDDSAGASTREQSPGESTRHPQFVRRQSTAEIVALQSQRSRYSVPTAADSSVCSVCQDDDYMRRPQIVQCTGQCKRFYHTTCAGLKRIPFGLTTLSDRTNHAVYVKKYFSAWECDACAPQPEKRPTPAAARSMASSHVGTSFVSAAAAGAATSSESSQPNQADPADEQLDKLKEFLTLSGVSVEDLLRAATNANVSITSTPNTPGKPTASSVEHSETTIPQLTISQDSKTHVVKETITEIAKDIVSTATPNQLDTLKVEVSLSTTKVSVSTQGPGSKSLESAEHEPQNGGGQKSLPVPEARPEVMSNSRSALLGQISARAAPAEKNTPHEAPQVDPRAALLAHLASRKVEDTPPVDPRAALLSHLASRKVEDTPPVDPRAALLAHLASRAGPEKVAESEKPSQPSSQAVSASDVPTTERQSDEAKQTKLKDMPEFKSYFNMLRLGCPMEAVKQKILMDGADPMVLVLGPDAIFEDVKDRITIVEASDRSTLQEDIKFVKGHKASDNKSTSKDEPAPQQTVGTTADDAKPESDGSILLRDHEVYSKYFKMLKMGLPEGAVRHKMRTEGADERALELGGDVPFSSLSKKEDSVRLADDPTYAKYFKMLKMGLPEGAVRHKMVSEGVNPRALVLGPDGLASQLNETDASSKAKAAAPAGAPKRRRKKLHWQPIPLDRLSSMNQTIWEDPGDEAVDIEMDMAELESLFFASSNTGSKVKSGGGAKPLQRKQKVTLIDPKRAMNAAISLARVKLNYGEIAEAVDTFDSKGLTVQQLLGIREFLPTHEEVKAVSTYTGDPTMLGEAEKFMMTISTVKRYIPRTECLVFKMSFPSRYEELKVSLGHLTGACDEVKGSRLLKILLSMVLKLGNTLNGSGEENEIRGFTVDSLLRLGHTKAVNQKTTVLHYLVRLVKKNHPAVLDFHKELKSVPSAARESFESLDEDFGKLQSGLTQLSEEFQEMQKDDSDTDTTMKSLEAAVEEIGAEMERMDQSIKHAREAVQSVFDYFGEDPSKNPSEFFTTLSSFCTAFEAARKEVDAADEAALRAERLKARKNSGARPTSGSFSVTSNVKDVSTRDRALTDLY
ncbi:hypothetical protein Poli38472_004519 [Pythium oligandrum]|uniref:Formin-like protein n=1 Tax=Pythium oligandrum TaxID=41045 RepID=A0A8K1CAX4_PYTOL|nr:hypothetical protein Poli38472_004519 [Pythium oligandrum]|eukprot:TMW59450.1 hypothetical protein Poli38472_004519 [Pythium oligandrum]